MAGRDSKGRFIAGVELSLIDRMTAPLRGLIANWDRLGKSAKRAERMFEVAGKIKHAADGVEDFSRSTIGLLEKPLKTGMDFQKTMSEVRAKTFKGDMTAKAQEDFAALTAKARELGATTSFSASQAAEGMTNLATAGFSANEQLAAMAGTLDIAKAGNESIANAAEIGANTLRGFGLEAAEMGRVGDVMVNTFTSSNTTLADLGETMKMVSTVAAGAGVSLEETAAAAGALGDVGIKGSMAGTTLRAMLLRFQAPDKKGKSALAFLGINTKDKNGNLKPFEDMLAEIDKALDRKFGKGKGGNRRAALLKGIFGEEPAAGAAALVEAAGSGKLQKLTTANRDSKGVANRIAVDMGDNAAGAAAELDSALEELQLTIADNVLPTFRELITTATGAALQFGAWAKEHPDLIKNVMLVAGAVGGFGLVLAPVLKGVSTIVTIFGTVVQVAGYVGTAIEVAASAFEILRLAVLSNPIVATVTAIAVAAYLIYDNWETLKSWWSGLWDSLPGPLQSAIRLMTVPIRTFVRAGQWLYDNWDTVATEFASLWDRFGAPVLAVLATIVAPLSWFINAGVELMGGWKPVGDFFLGVWNGIKSVVGGTIKWISEKIAWAGQQIEDLERSLPEWMTGRERKLVGGATDLMKQRMEAQGATMKAEGAPLSVGDGGDLMSKFLGQLKISVNGDGQVTKTELTASGDPGFEVRVNTGGQAA